MHAPILPRFAPLALCILYAAALLAARHQPLVVAHWTALLQAPRVAGFALALLVALRGRQKDEGPGAEAPSPPPAKSSRASFNPTSRPRLAQDPSRLVGLVMAGSAGVLAATGAWVAWPRVQAIAALSWLVVGAVALRAR